MIDADPQLGPEPEAEETPVRGAWEGLEDNSLLGITDRISELVHYANEELTTHEGLVRHGVDPSRYELTPTLTFMEMQAVSLGLHLVGFFSPRHTETAAKLLGQFLQLRKANLDSATDEEKAQIEAAYVAFQQEEFARLFGLTREEMMDVSGEAETTGEGRTSEELHAAAEGDEAEIIPPGSPSNN